MWPSVRRELKIAASLSWMTWRPLGCPLMRVVEVGDSATSGYALMSSEPPVDIVRRASLSMKSGALSHCPKN